MTIIEKISLLTLAPVMFLIGGCASTSTQMINDSGQAANCSASGWGFIGAPMALSMTQDCINKYKAAGYREAGSPNTGGSSAAAGTTMPQPNLSTTPTTVAGKDGFFKITLPAGWATVTPPNPSYQLAARNPAAETYLVVSSVKTADIADWQAFTETLKGKLIGNLTQSTSSETVKIRVNGFDALRADIAGTLINGARVHYLSTVVKTDQNLVYLLSWSLESKFASNRSEFESLPSALQM